MSNEEKFKNKVKGLLEEQSFPYDAANWEIASTALDNADKRKRRFIIWFFCGLGVLATAYLLLPGTKVLTSMNFSQEGKHKINISTEIDHAPIVKSQNVTPDAASKNEVRSLSTTVIIPDTRAVKHYPTNTPGEKKYNSKKADQQEVLTSPQKYNTTRVIAVKRAVPADTISNEKINAGTLVNNIDTRVYSPPIDQETAGKDVSEKNENLTPSSNDTENINGAVKEINIAQVQDSTDKTVKDTLLNFGATTIKSDSSAGTASPTTAVSPPINGFCFLEAGTFLSAGWTGAGNREGMSANLYAGVSYLNKFNERFGVSLGAYYSTVSKLSLGSKSIRSPKIVFGEESDVVVITPSTLNLFLIPFRIHYNINSSQVLTAGYTAAYLLDVQSKVQTYTERLGTQVDVISYKTGGYVQGFTTFSHQIGVGYRRRLYKDLWLNTEILYGLTDLRGDEFFAIKLKEKNTGLKISLTYDFMKK